MISVDPHDLWREGKAAVANTNEHLTAFERQVRGFATRCYAKGYETQEPMLETHALNWMGRLVGQLLDRNPEVVAEAGMVEHEEAALLWQHAMRMWTKRHNLIRTLDPVIVDMQFNCGVVLVSPEPVPGMRPMDYVGGVDEQGKPRRGLPWAPVVYRVPQRRFFVDPMATSLSDARFFGHVWVRDKADLMAEAEDSDSGWNAEVIEEMTMARSEENQKLLGRTPSPMNDQLRNEVVGMDVWIPEYKLDGATEGRDHGAIFTIGIDPVAASGDPTKSPKDMSDSELVSNSAGIYAKSYLREPRHMYGPRWGQYVIGGIFTVPDDPWPLGPLTATQDIEDAVNEVARANYRRARNWQQNTILGGKTAAGAQEQLNESEDGDTLVIPGWTNRDLGLAERFGLNEQTMAQEQWLRDKLSRGSTTPDSARGRISSSTATAVQYAEAAADTLTAMIQQRTYRFVEDVYRTVGWYHWYDNRVVSPLDAEAGRAIYGIPPGARGENGEPITVTYRGGMPSGDKGESYDALSITIEPNSMSHTDEVVQAQNALAGVQFLLQHRDIARLYPEFDWLQIEQIVGNALNQGSLRRLHNVEMAQAIGAMMMGMGQVPQQPGPNAGLGQPMYQGQAGGSGGGGTGGNFGAQSDPMVQMAQMLGPSGGQGQQAQPAQAMAAAG